MQIQQSPTNAMRRYVSHLVNYIGDHNVRSVLGARAQALVDQVCRAGPSAAGRRATFSILNDKPGIIPHLCKTRVTYGTCL